MESPIFFHKTVMIDEVIDLLSIKPGGIYVDATFGSGGHSRAILLEDSTCKVIGLDWDKTSLDKYGPLLIEEFGERFIPIYGNFAHLERLLEKKSIKHVDGILADFGTSQMQITERPGFSIYKDSMLDMRMSQGHQKIWASDILNKASVEELSHIFFTYGQERYSRRIARAIVEDRKKEPFKTTKQLATLIERIVPRNKKSGIHPATRVFQALRIQVNDELGNIELFLKQTMKVLSSSGRIVCISFHSLEDRIVKQFFREQKEQGHLEILTKKPVGPSHEEMSVNPSSRSAKIRAAKRIVEQTLDL